MLTLQTKSFTIEAKLKQECSINCDEVYHKGKEETNGDLSVKQLEK